MNRRLLRTLMAVLLATAVVGVVLPRSLHGTKQVATRGALGVAHNQSIRDALVTDGTALSTGTTDTTSGADPATATGTGTGTGSGAGAGTQETSTSVAAPPASAGDPATTSGPPTSTTAAPIGPPTGRLAVTLGVVRVDGSGPGGGIATMAADGSGRQVLVTGNYFDPRWTPDGRFVVFTSTDSFSTWAVATHGGPASLLDADVTGPISPDGTKVVHYASVPYSTAPLPLSVQPIAETATGFVAAGAATPLGGSGFGPVWSPDGRQILYSTEMGPFSDLAIVNADGSGRRDLLGSAPVKAMLTNRPGFSRDGSSISFIGNDNRAYFIDADGHNLRPALPDVVPGITNLSAFSTAWSPDHRSLAVLVDGANSVVVVDGSSHLLASIHLPVQGMPTGISFDGSGRHIYYMGGAESPPRLFNLYSVALDGTGSHRLSADGSILMAPTVLP